MKLKNSKKIRILRTRKGQRKYKQLSQDYLKDEKTTKPKLKNLFIVQRLKTFWGTVSFIAVLYLNLILLMYNKTIIELDFTPTVALDNSKYHKKPHPIIVYIMSYNNA